MRDVTRLHVINHTCYDSEGDIETWPYLVIGKRIRYGIHAAILLRLL